MLDFLPRNFYAKKNNLSLKNQVIDMNLRNIWTLFVQHGRADKGAFHKQRNIGFESSLGH